MMNTNSSNNIAEKVKTIITSRQKQAEYINTVIDKWKAVKTNLRMLYGQQKGLLNNKTSTTSINFSSKLEAINFDALIKKIEQELEALEILKQRLSRDTLNIGVVGRMRQGKSRLLQSLTGLDDDYVPTGIEGACTRVLSKIYHESNQDKQINEVEYHTYSSLEKILHLYFDHLKLEGIKPVVPDDLETLKYPPRLPEQKETDANARHLSLRLRGEYYKKFNDYKSLLGYTSKRDRISPKQIRNYITQVTDVDGNTNSQYLAVKELKIYCQFPHNVELGQIGVIDLPGLGDNSLVDVELLRETLKQDVDFILFVRRIDDVGDEWSNEDREIYQTACEALKDFPIKKCSFMVLNRVQTQEEQKSLKIGKFLQDKLEREKIIEVSGTVIADCTDPEEVKEKILFPALDNLTQNINEVHKQYLHSHEQRLERLKSEIEELLKPAFNVLEGYGHLFGKTFNSWFKQDLWKPLLGAIYGKRDELYELQKEKNVKFEARVKEVLEKIKEDTIIPSIQQIKQFRDVYGDSYKIAYYICINELRKNLEEEFEKLSIALEDSEKELQVSVVKILSENAELKKLTSQLNIEFFDEIRNCIPAHDTTEQLRAAFAEMKTSTTTYKKTISTWLQDYLNYLQPDKHLDPLSINQLKNEIGVNTEEINQIENDVSQLEDDQVAKIKTAIQEPSQDDLSKVGGAILAWLGVPLPEPINQKIAQLFINIGGNLLQKLIEKDNSHTSIITTQQLSADDSLERIQEEVKLLRNEVVAQCETKLQTMLSFPNQEAYSKFDKFVTLAFRNDLAETGWLDFYSDDNNKAILWPGSDIRRENKQVEDKWKELVNSAIKVINDKDLLLQT